MSGDGRPDVADLLVELGLLSVRVEADRRARVEEGRLTHERIEALEAQGRENREQVQALTRRLAKIERRIARLERGQGPATPADLLVIADGIDPPTEDERP